MPATSKGFSAVEFCTDVIGVVPLPWQRWLLIHALELRRDGTFRFRTVIVQVARQNGKTAIVEVKNLWKMFVLQVPLIISTAQDLDVAEESWDKAVEIVESIEELAAELKHVDKTNGKKTLRLTNGSRWKPKAAGRRPGRGLSGDDVNLDELREHQNWLAWAAITKTTMARANAQIWGYSNAGDDKSVVLNDLQDQGRAAAEHPERADTSLGYFEWSAPPDVKCTCRSKPHLPDCRLQDRQAWAQANPALGYTVTEAALASALATDPEPVFRTECLCQRVKDLGGEWNIVTWADWQTCLDAETVIEGPRAFAIEASHNLSHLSIGAAGRNAAQLRHLELVDRFPADTGKLVGWLKKRIATWDPVAVVIDPAGPAGYLIPEVEKHCRIEVVKPMGREVAAACGSVYIGISGKEQAARDIRVRVTSPPLNDALTTAVRRAVWRDRGDARVFDRRIEDEVDTAPLMSITLADWAMGRAPTKQPFNPGAFTG